MSQYFKIYVLISLVQRSKPGIEFSVHVSYIKIIELDIITLSYNVTVFQKIYILIFRAEEQARS